VRFVRQNTQKSKLEFDQSTDRIINIIKNTKKIVKIGCFSALPKNEIVTPLVDSIVTMFSELDIEIVSDTMDQIKFMLDDGIIDIGVTNAHDFEDWIGYKRINIKTMPAQIIVGPTSPLGREKRNYRG
jgi:hypothetical protein